MNTPTFFFSFFLFFCGRYMILSRIEGGFAKKKKRKRRREGGRKRNRSEIEASGPWIPREWHRLANEGGFRTPYTSPFQTNWLEWKRTRRGWLVGWLARYQTRGRGWIRTLPTIKSQITSSDTLHRLVASSWLPCLSDSIYIYIYICESNWSTNVLNPCSSVGDNIVARANSWSPLFCSCRENLLVRETMVNAWPRIVT